MRVIERKRNFTVGPNRIFSNFTAFSFFLPFSGKEYNVQNLKDIEVTAEITALNPQTNC